MTPRPAEKSAEAEALAVINWGRALATLSAHEHEALLLTVWEGLDPDQLAVALGITRNAAALRLHKAKVKVRRHFGSQPALTASPAGEAR